MPWYREDFLEKYINFTLFTPKLAPFFGGPIKFIISCLLTLPYICYISHLVHIGPVVLEKNMLMCDARRTTTDAKPIEIGHLIDSSVSITLTKTLEAGVCFF